MKTSSSLSVSPILRTSAAAGAQVLVGLAALVLGVLALCGVAPMTMILAAALTVSAFVLLNSSAVGSWLLGLLHEHLVRNRCRARHGVDCLRVARGDAPRALLFLFKTRHCLGCSLHRGCHADNSASLSQQFGHSDLQAEQPGLRIAAVVCHYPA